MWLVGGLGALALLVTLLPFLPTDRWYVRMWDFPRLQLLVLLVAVLVAWLLLARRRSSGVVAFGGALALASAWQATYAAPYLPLGPHKVASAVNCAPGNEISLLNINVLQDNRDREAVLDLVRARNPDVVLFVETDAVWARALAPLAKAYPHRESVPLPNTYGMILMSRWPIEARIRYRLQPDIPSIDARLTLPSGQEVDLYALHPEPPLPGDDAGERDAELVMVGRETRKSGRATIILGDLNDVAWSDTSRLFREVSGTADPRVGRGLYPTFNARYPLFQWPLDHMFVTPHWRVMQLDRLGHVGSDHYPIFYRFCLARPAAERMTAPRPNAEAQADARNETAEGIEEMREEGHDTPKS